MRDRSAGETVAGLLAGRSAGSCVFYLGRDKNGRAKQTTKVFAGTKREAESALAAFVAETERGRRARTSRALFADYARQWLASRKRAKELAIKSLERYEGIIRDHLVPHLGHLRISAIGAHDIREALAQWRTGGVPTGSAAS